MEASALVREQFTDAYKRYADAIVRHCVMQGAQQQDAEEYVQEAFLKTWEYLCSGRPVANLKTFLYQAAVNRMVDDARRRKRKAEISLDALHEQGFDPGKDDSGSLQTRLEAKTLIHKVQKEKEHNLLMMRYIQGFPVSHIATMVGQTPNTVAVRLHRAVKRLSRLSLPLVPFLRSRKQGTAHVMKKVHSEPENHIA